MLMLFRVDSVGENKREKLELLNKKEQVHKLINGVGFVISSTELTENKAELNPLIYLYY